MAASARARGAACAGAAWSEQTQRQRGRDEARHGKHGPQCNRIRARGRRSVRWSSPGSGRRSSRRSRPWSGCWGVRGRRGRSSGRRRRSRCCRGRRAVAAFGVGGRHRGRGRGSCRGAPSTSGCACCIRPRLSTQQVGLAVTTYQPWPSTVGPPWPQHMTPRARTPSAAQPQLGPMQRQFSAFHWRQALILLASICSRTANTPMAITAAAAASAGPTWPASTSSARPAATAAALPMASNTVVRKASTLTSADGHGGGVVQRLPGQRRIGQRHLHVVGQLDDVAEQRALACPAGAGR